MQSRVRIGQMVIVALAAGIVTTVAPTWGQVINEDIKLLPSDGEQKDYFGESVAIDGGVIAVGSILGDASGTGSVYLFDAYTGAEIARLLASDGAVRDYFGRAVAIDSGIIAIGAEGDDDTGEDAGSAYLFDLTTGQELLKLLPDDGAAYDYFGESIAISDGIVVVGARNDDDNGAESGSAYLFDASTGNQLAKLLPNDGAGGDLFGHAVAIDGSIVAVGASRDDNTGSAYLFDADTGTQISKLIADDATWDGHFGLSIAIGNGIVAVGSIGNGQRPGAVYLFDASSGFQTAKLVALDSGGIEDRFGYRVSISDDIIAIGAPSDDDNGYQSGSAYLYDASSGAEVKKLLPSDGTESNWFGASISIDNGIVAVGTPRDDDLGAYSGSAYVFDLDYPTLSVSPDPLLAGQDATFTAENLNPDTNSYLAYSLRGLGSTFVGALNVTLDLERPAQAGGMVTSDGAGTAQWVLHVPNAGAGRDVWFQACQFELTTNVVASHIE
ncbi:MAG: hypothetical protein D8M59_03500 [Planctomycetes bacterium]|nr:hypothetical protein [Planctomycetota bacterium]NOG53063.1 hypothetical protein [Planctomycetota bacterium]